MAFRRPRPSLLPCFASQSRAGDAASRQWQSRPIPLPREKMAGALEGIRIVDLTNIILGPYGTMLLADQGADVIKVEAPEGDMVRHIGKPAKTPGMGPTYLYVNRNKRSLCLDLKNPAAKAALLKLVATADAFVHALRPQAIEGLGLGYE